MMMMMMKHPLNQAGLIAAYVNTFSLVFMGVF